MTRPLSASVLELKAVVVPTSPGDEQTVLARMVDIATSIGTVIGHERTSYSKPEDASMLRVEATCSGDAQDIVQRVLEQAGGTGWFTQCDDEEAEAVWSPSEGLAPPLAVSLTWAHAQVFPMRARQG